MHKLYISGFSDDLIELNGAIEDEISNSSGRPMYLRFTNGVHLSVEYTKSGIWSIAILDVGQAESVKKIGEGVEDENEKPLKPHGISGISLYSDCVEVLDTLPIKLFLWSRTPIEKPDTAALIAAEALFELKDGDLIDSAENDEAIIGAIARAVRNNLNPAAAVTPP